VFLFPNRPLSPSLAIAIAILDNSRFAALRLVSQSLVLQVCKESNQSIQYHLIALHRIPEHSLTIIRLPSTPHHLIQTRLPTTTKMKLSTTLFPLLVITLHSATALPTWPSTIDELEDTMYLQTGYRAKNFASGVTPCGTSTFGTSRVTSAEWIRSAFHDMGNANVLSQTGGLDASLNFETSRLENDGQAFKSTLSYMAPYYSAQLPLADLLALAVYTAVRSCGGPIVPMRGGRRDAKVAGTSGFLPAPQNAISIFVAQFDRMGFNRTDMINLVACGHRLGGVHSSNFPEVVPVGSAPPDDFVRFVPSAQAFDEKIATEYLAGNSTNPLVVGPAITSSRASDSRVFGSDGNVTIRALAADRTTFRNTCSRVLQQMIEVVPSGVVLSDVLVPYEVKPVAVQLTLLDGGASVAFSGEIRVRVTSRAQSLIQSVVLVYKDRSGTCPAGSCTITTAVAGTAAGFDDSFVVCFPTSSQGIDCGVREAPGTAFHSSFLA